MEREKPITVRELIAHLQTFPQDLQVIQTRCSDYMALELADISVVSARMVVSGPHGWLRRVHRSEEASVEATDYLHFAGN